MLRQNNFSAALAACGAIGALAVALSAAPSVARAEAARADPIDTTMQNCLARADRSTTAGQVQCIDTARDAWQAAIDAALRSISASAPADDQRGWEASQRKWLAWRKEEVPLVHAVFDTTKGGAYSITQANVLLQSVRDRALAVRHAASRFAPPQPVAASGGSAAAVPASASGSLAAGASAGSSTRGTSSGAGMASAAAARAQSDDTRAHNERMRPCTADASCEHAQFDLRRYARTLREKLPAHARPVLLRAQRAWGAYFDATSPLGTEAERADLIGERVATVKRLSETVGND